MAELSETSSLQRGSRVCALVEDDNGLLQLVTRTQVYPPSPTGRKLMEWPVSAAGGYAEQR